MYRFTIRDVLWLLKLSSLARRIRRRIELAG
jgi:hypothetical protein